MSQKLSPIVGIDLGTTYSAVALYENNRVRFFPNPLGHDLTPSVVGWDRRGQGMVVGRQAKDILATRPDDAAALFKREMGRDDKISIGDRSFTPVELSAWILDSLRADAERALGCAVTRCVVTVPAYFNEAQRFATKRAAETAGFTVERVLNEPTAAAIAYGLHGGVPNGTAPKEEPDDDERRFLVFDLGGGTFDVCVMELFEGMLEVRSVAGESRLGGEDFTEALTVYALREAGLDPAVVARDQPADMALVRKRSEVVKRTLSRWPKAEVLLPEGLDSHVIGVTQAAFEQATASLRERMVGPCRAALRSASLGIRDLQEVLLVGGATRMPGVRAFIEDVFGKPPLDGPDPDRVVAHGAAIQAALCANDQAVSDLVVTDVASHSLGVEVTREIAGKRHAGFFSPIIHRNTVIPTTKLEVYQTVRDDQTAIDLEIYEGEARRVQDNHRLGVLEIKGLPKSAAGTDFSVRFTFDLDGILEVEARVATMDKHFTQIFQREGKELDAVAMERVRDRMRALKADPHDRPRYRDALTRADLLWRELPAEKKPLLDHAIDAFEGALRSDDSEAMSAAFERLQTLCERLDDGERW